MAAPTVHGPVDFVLIEFPDDHLTGRAAEELLTLVDRDIVHLFDVLIVGKQSDGTTYALDLAEAAEAAGWFREPRGGQHRPPQRRGHA